MSKYYNMMMYSSYYNNMYGGYGGYGGYGYGGYNNYYYYYMMSQMLNQDTGTSYTSAVMVDTHRYYKGRLLGPTNTTGRVPTLKLVFSVPQQ